MKPVTYCLVCSTILKRGWKFKQLNNTEIFSKVKICIQIATFLVYTLSSQMKQLLFGKLVEYRFQACSLSGAGSQAKGKLKSMWEIRTAIELKRSSSSGNLMVTGPPTFLLFPRPVVGWTTVTE